MTIDIIKSNNEATVKEAVNIASQYGALVNNPKMKLRDSFKERIIYIYISLAVFAALVTLTLIFWKVSALTIIAVAVLVIAAILGVVIHLRMKNAIRQYMEDKSKRQVVLDEKGIDIRKDGATVLRKEWNDVAAMRLFNETFCLIEKKVSGPAVVINKAHFDEIKKFIQTETNANIEMIGIG